MKRNRIIICGGHLSPALAVLEVLLSENKSEIFYIGRKYSLEGDRALSFEYRTIKKMGIPFLEINPGRLQRSLTVHTYISLLRIPLSFIQSLLILLRIRPAVVVSFGSYVALPVTVACGILGIPLIIHEQTSIMGLSNRISAIFARKVCLSFPKTQYAPHGIRTVVTGNPVRKSMFLMKGTDMDDFGNRKLPFIYITGGSQGSQSINTVILEVLPEMSGKYRVLHQCGSARGMTDYNQLIRTRNQLPGGIRENYVPIPSVDPEKIGPVMQKSDLIISRSGANTVTEILILGKPAILIPLPWSAQNEQEKNALMARDIGKVEIIFQKDLDGKRLLNLIEKMITNADSGKIDKQESFKQLHRESAGKIVGIIDEYCQQFK